jgi:hypothetical protein
VSWPTRCYRQHRSGQSLGPHSALATRRLAAGADLVGDVPAQRAEAAALLDDGVEEAEGVAQLLPLGGLGARVEEGRVGDGVEQEGALHVEAQALGGLVGHLDAVLQDAHGEDGRGVRGEPQAEVAVRRVRLEVLADALQRHHPAAAARGVGAFRAGCTSKNSSKAHGRQAVTLRAGGWATRGRLL